jgi:DNA-binding NarL/FixJ family response regulator
MQNQGRIRVVAVDDHASTARFHVSIILSKLGAANRAEAAALAVKHGLIY